MGFNTFLKENGLNTLIKIEERISSFKEKNPAEKLLIVFDFNQMIELLVKESWNSDDSAELYCGGRERILFNVAEDWLKKLAKLDCKLVFWCASHDGEEDTILQKSKSICKIISTDTVRSDNLFPIFEIVPIYFDGLIEMAKIYGKVFFSLENKLNQDIAYYATINDAIAVVSQDTDMIFFDGSWEIWSSYRINSSSSTMINKKEVQEYLKLNKLQMTLFAVLYKTLTEREKLMCLDSFEQFASFLSENIKETKYCNILNDSVINPIISYLEGYEVFPTESFFKIKIEHYGFENINVVTFDELYWLKHHTAECGIALYEILYELDINMRLLFAQGVPEFPTHLKNIKLRQIGLVRYSEWIKTNKKFHTTFHIFCKDYEIFTEEPIYPLAPVPTISTILGYENQKLSIDQKLQFAIWVIFGENASSQWSIDFVKDLKNYIGTTLVSKLVLTFLLKNNVITKTEANIVAISLKISERNGHLENTNCPTMLHRRCIQLGYVYLYTIFSVSTSLKMCGLSKYLTSGYFDGFIFHNIYNKFFNETENLIQLIDFINLIF